MAVMTDDASRDNTLAKRLSRLFETVHPPYTPREVADAINARAGVEVISATQLSQLQTGRCAEPSHSHLVAIARFFGVDVGYLSDKAADVGSIALRAQGLSPASLATVRAVIENARRLEGLPSENEPQP